MGSGTLTSAGPLNGDHASPNGETLKLGGAASSSAHTTTVGTTQLMIGGSHSTCWTSQLASRSYSSAGFPRFEARHRPAPGLPRRICRRFSALSGSPGARAYYDALRDRDISYNAALRQLGNRLVGIMHGCLKTHTPYDEAVAWNQHTQQAAA